MHYTLVSTLVTPRELDGYFFTENEILILHKFSKGEYDISDFSIIEQKLINSITEGDKQLDEIVKKINSGDTQGLELKIKIFNMLTNNIKDIIYLSPRSLYKDIKTRRWARLFEASEYLCECLEK